MDLPRTPTARRGRRVAVAAVLAVLVLGYGPLKHAAIDALEVGARAGFRLTAGAPGIEPQSLRRRTADGAAWLETMSTPQETDAASSPSRSARKAAARTP